MLGNGIEEMENWIPFATWETQFKANNKREPEVEAREVVFVTGN